ncbi:neuroglobin [Aplysia californica]|uniref:Globin n=1 Tax=Aplysia californica TaxID=6500 RepID=A0ABM1VYU2_APLCA|nr:neuroglobin [Aplysia californica]XP_012942038.1 neuroglobin [Aplysia californica]XP_035827583.1 neuroglobin [Aplysia californica]XP_035827584.1 neuroglobin [Aplysia californica]XP_035827585.1 neuroglobin [Aplysia californica]
MGNTPAVSCLTDGGDVGSLNKYLTARQLQLVQDTWDVMKQDLPALGLTVFLKLFQTEPDLKRLFPKIVQMNEKNELEWEVDKDMLQRHAVTVMEGLGAAVESLEDSDFLNSVLVSIGQTHVKRNVKPQMLRRLWPSLNHGFSEMLGEQYTKETMEAWRRLYNYISCQMKRGMQDPEGKLLDDAETT